MKTQWLIENFDSENSYLELYEEVKRQGHDAQIVRYGPFESNDLKSIEVDPARPVVFQGSIQMARQLQRQRSHWLPGPIANWRNYNCSVYYAYWSRWLLNQDFRILPFGAVPWDANVEGQDYFMRPDVGSKLFNGTVIAAEDITSESNVKRYIAAQTSAEDLVVVAKYKEISHEWRVVCTKGRVITGSRYKTHGQTDYQAGMPHSVAELALKICSTEWQPDPIYVIDICERASTRKLHLLEIGALSVAGLYLCDVSKIVEAANEVALAEFEDLHV